MKSEDKGLPESVVLSQCLTYLKCKGLFAWRQNTGSFKTEGGRYFKSGLPGTSDILGLLPDGRFLAVECKREKGGKVSREQLRFLESIAWNNGIAIVCHSVEELQEKIEKELKKVDFTKTRYMEQAESIGLETYEMLLKD